jgi:hypothetical protein
MSCPVKRKSFHYLQLILSWQRKLMVGTLKIFEVGATKSWPGNVPLGTPTPVQFLKELTEPMDVRIVRMLDYSKGSMT